MKIKVFQKVVVPIPEEKEVFVKLEGHYLSNSVSVFLVNKDGTSIGSPYIFSLQVNPGTGKLTFTRTGGVNPEYVEISGSYKGIKEI